MSKIDKLKEKYIEDTEMMASKSRFGYFSLLPSHTAAITQESAPARNISPIQRIASPTGKFILSLETSTPALLQLARLRKTTSRILLLPFMALLSKIQERPRGS